MMMDLWISAEIYVVFPARHTTNGTACKSISSPRFRARSLNGQTLGIIPRDFQ